MTGDTLATFKRQLEPKRVTIDGETYWVAEGDLLLDADQLSLYADQRENDAQQTELRRQAAERGFGAVPGGERAALVAVTSEGKLVRWKDGLILTYCILKNTFGSDQEYRVARAAVERATEAWERICGIQFRHRASLDTSASTRVEGVKFTVRKIDAGGRFIAAAFFPNDPPERRRVLIDPSFFSPNLGFDQVGVLRHELGHVLGFRHEHIRSEAPASCPDEDLTDTLVLTAYDPKSVMHYFCGGVGSRELAISDKDVTGAQRLYGLPLNSYTFVE